MKIVDLKLEIVPAKLGYEIRHEKEVLGRIYYRPEDDGTDEGAALATAIQGLPGLLRAASDALPHLQAMERWTFALQDAIYACLAGEKEAE